MKKYLRNINILIVLLISSSSILAFSYQTFGSDVYDPTQRAPQNIMEASELAKVIGSYIDNQPRFSTGSVTNKVEAIAKMKEMHCIGRVEGDFDNKSCFNTDDDSVLNGIYDLVVNDPDEYIVDQGDQHSLIKLINDPSVVGMNPPLGFASSQKEIPLNIVTFTFAGIRTSKELWKINKARVLSVFLISEEEYDGIQKKLTLKSN